MRTLNWYDVKWSKTEVNVNEDMELTGKVHVFSGWPQAVAKPEQAFLNVASPVRCSSARRLSSAAFRRRAPSAWRSPGLRVQIVLRARRQGRYHVHVADQRQGRRPDRRSRPVDQHQGRHGQLHQSGDVARCSTVDLETLGIKDDDLPLPVDGGGGLLGDLLVHAEGHYRARLAGRGRQGQRHHHPADKRFGGLWLAGSMLALLIFYAHANNEFPRTLPMQAGLLTRIDPMHEGPVTVIPITAAAATRFGGAS